MRIDLSLLHTGLCLLFCKCIVACKCSSIPSLAKTTYFLHFNQHSPRNYSKAMQMKKMEGNPHVTRN